MASIRTLKQLASRIRYDILDMTTRAKSGHPSSSLSAVELMSVLFFDGFLRYDLAHPNNPNNDRVIFSKGHASPLLYALYAAAGKIPPRELQTLRKFESPLEGHPSMRFRYTEAPTGSLGQGLSVGAGFALNAQYLDKLPYTTYVLLGDSEMAEGQIWEAIELAAHYKLKQLIGILDVNRLGQSGTTMYGHNLMAYKKKLEAFGLVALLCDGHNITDVRRAFTQAKKNNSPSIIIAKTIKGKGVSLMEDKMGWHGKPLTSEQWKHVKDELGDVNHHVRGTIRPPQSKKIKIRNRRAAKRFFYTHGDEIATRTAYGNALMRLADAYPEMVVLDAEVSNSTKTESFRQTHPKRFFEMYIAEQNMASLAAGLARTGKLPFVNSFAAFLTRANDQIRMNQYSDAHIVYVGSHAGTSIGYDGPSQMGLTDIAFFRSLFNSTVLYPSDAVSAEKCTELAIRQKGTVYIRNTRMKLPVRYNNTEHFSVGGSKTLTKNKKDMVTIIAAGVTVHEALKAHEALLKEHIPIRIIDAYSVKPLDKSTIRKAARETGALIIVEDHVHAGGLGEAVRSLFTKQTPQIQQLCVNKTPRSGKPHELLQYEGIDASAIIRTVRRLIKK